MSTETQIRKQVVSKNRITVSNECYDKLQQWEAQANDHYKGLNIKPSELVEWCILSHTDKLTDDELSELQSKYFDDVALVAWALRELKRARAAGENKTIEELLGLAKVLKKVPSRSRRKEHNEDTQRQVVLESVPTEGTDSNHAG